MSTWSCSKLEFRAVLANFRYPTAQNGKCSLCLFLVKQFTVLEMHYVREARHFAVVALGNRGKVLCVGQMVELFIQTSLNLESTASEIIKGFKHDMVAVGVSLQFVPEVTSFSKRRGSLYHG